MRVFTVLLVMDFFQMWWLLKEPFLATYSASVLHEPVVGKFVSDKWDERRL